MYRGDISELGLSDHKVIPQQMQVDLDISDQLGQQFKELHSKNEKLSKFV